MNRLNLIARLATLGVAVAAVLVATSSTPIAHQGSTSVQEVLTLNGKYRPINVQIRGLALAPDFVITIEDLPEELQGKVEKSEIEEWVKDELARSAPDANVITRESRQKRLDGPNGNPAEAPNLEGYLTRIDNVARSLYVSLSYLKTQDGVQFYHTNLDFNRAGITPTGVGLVAVFNSNGYGSFSSASALKERLKNSVSSHVKRFATAWKQANNKE